MKVGIWGAGNLGPALAYRLATTSFVSELFWANRTYDEIAPRVIDIEHGLAFAPTCHAVHGYRQDAIGEMLPLLDVLVVTLGKRVSPGLTRADVYSQNAAIFRSTVIPPLLDGFKGIVLAVSNPVDLIARLLYREARLDRQRVFGLGTVVETARLRASLGSYLSPQRPAREVWAYAVGTHDPNFVPVVMPGLAVGDTTGESELADLVALAKGEVAKAADRVKTADGSSVHPIVEGVIEVLEAIAFDRRSILTVSVLDPDTPEELFYSAPCCIGQVGIVMRDTGILGFSHVSAALSAGCDAMKTVLRDAGELAPPSGNSPRARTDSTEQEGDAHDRR